MNYCALRDVILIYSLRIKKISLLIVNMYESTESHIDSN